MHQWTTPLTREHLAGASVAFVHQPTCILRTEELVSHYHYIPWIYLNLPVSDNFICQPDLPAGCPRCAYQISAVCCELCSPIFFKDFGQVDLPKKKAAALRSRIKDYEASTAELSLRDALHVFRRETTTSRFGWATLSDMGPSIIMSDAILQRIVDCAHDFKIDSVQSLIKETRWLNAQMHGTEVISLIQRHCPKPIPVPLFSSTPLRPMQPPSLPLHGLSTANLVPIKHIQRCGKCGATTHNGQSCNISISECH